MRSRALVHRHVQGLLLLATELLLVGSACAITGCSQGDTSAETTPPTCQGSEPVPASDYPLFSPAAFFNRPVSYWGADVDDVGTAALRTFLTSDARCSGVHPGIGLGGYSIYWVHDGDADLKEYSILRVYNGTTTPFTCAIPDRDPISTFRIPSPVEWSYPSSPGNHDHHLFVIDVSRNVVLSFYTYDAANMGEVPGHPSEFMSEYVNCDLLHGDDDAILAAEESRWQAGPNWSSPDQPGGVGGLGYGFGWPNGVTNGGESIGGALLPQDFVLPDTDDLGHVLNCDLPADLQNGKTWPAEGPDGSEGADPSLRIRSGTIVRIDPAWPIPADTPDWEARILRTWQRYGCMIDDNNAPEGCIGSRGAGTWSGPGGSNLWVGALPPEILGTSHHEVGLSLSHFPADAVQVMQPYGPAYTIDSQPVPDPAPSFAVSHAGRLAFAAGASGSLEIFTTLVAGTSGPVSFTVSGMPAGANASLAPESCTPTTSASCSTSLSVTADAAISPDTYPVTLQAQLGADTVTTTFELALDPEPLPLFLLVGDPRTGASVAPVGEPTVIPMAVALLSGGPRTVSFGLSGGLPDGMTASFAPASCLAPCSTVLTISAFPAEGSYSLTAMAIDEACGSAVATFDLAVRPNLIVNPSFEDLTSGAPEPWSLSPANVSVDDAAAHWGAHSIKIEVGSDSQIAPQISQSVAVMPSSRYRISFWTEESSDATNNGGYVVQYDAGDAVVPDGAGNTQTSVPQTASPGPWILAATDVTTMPTTVKLMFYTNIYHGTGTVSVDDVAIIADPP